MAQIDESPADRRLERQRRRGRQPSLTLEKIARAALDVADEEGLEAVTIKRIAEALGVGAMTLYGYVRTKEQILDAMTEIAVAQLALPTDGPWQEQIYLFFSRLHEMLVQHPALALLNARQPFNVGPFTLSAIERALTVILSSGLTGEDAVRSFRTLMSHTLGSALFYVARRGDLADMALRQRSTTMHAVPLSEFPVIVMVADELADETTVDHFHRGLVDLIAGIEAEMGGSHEAVVKRLSVQARTTVGVAASDAEPIEHRTASNADLPPGESDPGQGPRAAGDSTGLANNR